MRKFVRCHILSVIRGFQPKLVWRVTSSTCTACRLVYSRVKNQSSPVANHRQRARPARESLTRWARHRKRVKGTKWRSLSSTWRNSRRGVPLSKPRSICGFYESKLSPGPYRLDGINEIASCPLPQHATASRPIRVPAVPPPPPR